MSFSYLPIPAEPGPEHSVTKVRSLSNGGQLSLHRDGGYTYAYGPSGLKGLWHSRYAALSALFSGLGGCTFGYDQGVISNILVMPDFVDRFGLSALQVGIMTALLELGALFGALACGFWADRWSRQKAISLACVFFCCGSLIQTVANGFVSLTLGRAIGGIGIGALSMLCPLYMAEIASPETRGALVALEQFSIVLGVVLGFWIGFATRALDGSQSWRWPLGIQIIPGILLGVGALLLPPSPRLLVIAGKEREALQALKKLRNREDTEDPLLQLELMEMRVETLLLEEEQEHGHATWSDLFSSKLIDRTKIGVIIMFFQQWSGINALLYYGPTLMKIMGLQGETVLITSGMVNVVQFLSCIPAIIALDTWGRTPLLKVGTILTSFSHAFVAIMIYQGQSDWANHQTQAWVSVGLVFLFTAAYGLSLGPIAWVLPSEIFPLSVRSKGVAMSTASNWANNFLIGLITPLMVETSAVATFALFAISCAGAFFWVTTSVPETKGLSLEEVDALFSSTIGQSEATKKQQAQRKVGLDNLLHEIMDENDGTA